MVTLYLLIKKFSFHFQTSYPIRVPQPAHTPAAAGVGSSPSRSGAAFSPLIPLAGIQVRNSKKLP